MTIARPILEDIQQCLREAKNAQATLDTLDDSVSAAIGDVEAALGELALGFALTHSKQYGEDGYMGLSYSKWGGKWRLLYVYGDAFAPEEEVAKPLVDCDRDTRTEMVAMLPALLLSGQKQLKKRIAGRNTALRDARKIVDAILGATNIPF